jgi:signal peptidase
VDGYTVAVRRLPGTRSGGDSAALAEEPKERSLRQRVFGKLARIGLNVMFVAMIGCVAIMLGPAIAGYHRYVILTGSMTGTYDRGSIVFDKPVPTSSLKVGDPITYDPPPGFTSQTRVSHRIWRITTGKNGLRIYKTKGDANKNPDIWTFTLTKPTQDKVIFHIPEIGYLFLLLSLRNFRIVLVGVPAILIGLFMVRGLWRDAGDEVKRQKLAAQGWRQLADGGSGAVLAPVDTPATDWHVAVLDLGLARSVETSVEVPEPPRKRRARLRTGTTLRINRIGVERANGSTNDRRHSSNDAGHITLGANAPARPLRIRRLADDVRAAERARGHRDALSPSAPRPA